MRRIHNTGGNKLLFCPISFCPPESFSPISFFSPESFCLTPFCPPESFCPISFCPISFCLTSFYATSFCPTSNVLHLFVLLHPSVLMHHSVLHPSVLLHHLFPLLLSCILLSLFLLSRILLYCILLSSILLSHIRYSFLHTSVLHPLVPHPSCPSSIMSFYHHVLLPSCPSTIMSFIYHVLHPSCPSSRRIQSDAHPLMRIQLDLDQCCGSDWIRIRNTVETLFFLGNGTLLGGGRARSPLGALLPVTCILSEMGARSWICAPAFLAI